MHCLESANCLCSEKFTENVSNAFIRVSFVAEILDREERNFELRM